MSYFERLGSDFTHEPVMVTNQERTFVIIGSYDHGMQIPPASVPKLVNFLDGVVALKMEGQGEEERSQFFHPMSAEILTQACVAPPNLSWITESDGEDIGQKLIQYGVPKGIMEVSVPSLVIRMHDGVPNDFSQRLPIMFEKYKQRFGFLDITQGIKSFLGVLRYWGKHKLDLVGDLSSFSYDFEMFMGKVREYEFWGSDLKQFQATQQGRIAVCCGVYHVPFVQSLLTGQEIEKPDWKNHIDKNSSNHLAVDTKEVLEKIYRNLDAALCES